MATVYLLKIRTVEDRTGKRKSAIYADIADGLFPQSVKIGPRAAAWPSDEVEAIIRARIAGKSEDEIRALVADLHEQRKQAA